MLYSVLILGVLFASVFIILRDRKCNVFLLLLKILASIFFICLGFLAMVKTTQVDSLFFALMLIGGVFALIGDIVLDLKYLYPQDGAVYLISGMSSFSICHLFFIVSTCIYFGTSIYFILGGIILGILVFLSTNFMKIDLGKFKINSAIYSLILSTTLLQSIYLLIKQQNAFTIMFFVGALMFMLSDMILMLTYFKGKDSKFYIATNHFCYYLAQYLIFGSLFFCGAMAIA